MPIVDPAGAGPLMWVVPVPETKTIKNRMHFDVVGETWPLLARRRDAWSAPQDDEIEWDVLADPEGNEFCVFAPE